MSENDLEFVHPDYVGAQREMIRIRRSTFCVDHIEREDHKGSMNTSIRLEVDSPWCKATAYFPSCGETDWREWLAEIGSDYIGDNLFGLKTRVPDYHKTLSGLRGWINEMRAEDTLTVAEANALRTHLRDHHSYKADIPVETQFQTLLGFVEGNEVLREGGNPVAYREAPRFRSFNRNAWGPFTEYLRAELDRERAREPICEVVGLVSDEQVQDPDWEMAP